MVAHWGALILCAISLETLQQGDNLQQLPFIKTAFYKTECLDQAYGYFSLTLFCLPNCISNVLHMATSKLSINKKLTSTELLHPITVCS